MYACICHPTTESEVAAAVADGHETVEEIGEVTGAGTGCGTCHEHLDEIVARTLPEHCPIRRLIAA